MWQIYPPERWLNPGDTRMGPRLAQELTGGGLLTTDSQAKRLRANPPPPPPKRWLNPVDTDSESFFLIKSTTSTTLPP